MRSAPLFRIAHSVAAERSLLHRLRQLAHFCPRNSGHSEMNKCTPLPPLMRKRCSAVTFLMMS
jgi:hypothetical protein